MYAVSRSCTAKMCRAERWNGTVTRSGMSCIIDWILRPAKKCCSSMWMRTDSSPTTTSLPDRKGAFGCRKRRFFMLYASKGRFLLFLKDAREGEPFHFWEGKMTQAREEKGGGGQGGGGQEGGEQGGGGRGWCGGGKMVGGGWGGRQCGERRGRSGSRE